MAQRSPILVVLLVAILIGFLAGGRLRGFERMRVHWWALAFAGVLLQSVPVPEIREVAPDVVGTGMLIGSYVLLLTFLTVNRWVPAAGLMAIGLLMNLAVVSLNGGMPVSEWAIRTAGGSSSVQMLATDASPKHHLMTEDDLLAPIGDVIPIPPPFAVVLSVGDVLLYSGMAWFVIQVMRKRSRENPRPLAMWFLTYRGKHAPSHWRMPARYRSSGHAGAGQSGT